MKAGLASACRPRGAQQRSLHVLHRLQRLVVLVPPARLSNLAVAKQRRRRGQRHARHDAKVLPVAERGEVAEGREAALRGRQAESAVLEEPAVEQFALTSAPASHGKRCCLALVSLHKKVLPVKAEAAAYAAHMQGLNRAAHDVEQGLPDLVRGAVDDEHQRRRGQRLRAQPGALELAVGLRQQYVIQDATGQRACLPSRSAHRVKRLIWGQKGGPMTSCMCGRLPPQSRQGTAPCTPHTRACAIRSRWACLLVSGLAGRLIHDGGGLHPALHRRERRHLILVAHGLPAAHPAPPHPTLLETAGRQAMSNKHCCASGDMWHAPDSSPHSANPRAKAACTAHKSILSRTAGRRQGASAAAPAGVCDQPAGHAQGPKQATVLSRASSCKA